MNSIGFKNFRRFAEFKPIDFKGINFLVGRNNSGKSTMVKALMLIIDYLHSDDVRQFSFSRTNIENVNIVTFGRAKCRYIKNLDVISFQLQLDNIRIAL